MKKCLFYTLKFCVIVVVIININESCSATQKVITTADIIANEEFQRDDELAEENRQTENLEESTPKTFKMPEPTHMTQYIPQRKVYTWHHYTSYVIFIFVLLLVTSGVVFSALQFMAQNKQPSNVSKLKISKEGIEASSSVMGIVILVISLGFFFLYLHFVYTIKTEMPQKPQLEESKTTMTTPSLSQQLLSKSL
jgi:hypothetical protein